MDTRTTARLLEHKHLALTVQRHDRKWFEPDTGDIAWLRFEIMGMYWAVNDLRVSLGKEPISLMLIEQAERSASGHIDYVSKFCYYCAQLVMED